MWVQRERESRVRLRQQESVRENQVVSLLTDTHLGLLGGIRGKTCGLQNELPMVSSLTVIPLINSLSHNAADAAELKFTAGYRFY